MTTPTTALSTMNPASVAPCPRIGRDEGARSGPRPRLPAPGVTGIRRGHYRSTSPKTGSTEPMMATTSATLCPGMMWGSTARFEKDAPRHFMR